MGRGHGLFLGRASFFEGDDIADVVGTDFIDQAVEFLKDEFTDFFFRPGRPGGFADAAEEGDVDGHGGDSVGGWDGEASGKSAAIPLGGGRAWSRFRA